MFFEQLLLISIIGCSIFLLSINNPVHSILLVVALYVQASLLLIMLGAEFLAALLLLVYVGAITILFLFVIMMLDIQVSNKRPNKVLLYIVPFFFFITVWISAFVLNFKYLFADFLKKSGLKVFEHMVKSPIPNKGLVFYGNEEVYWISLINTRLNVETFACIYTHFSIFVLLAGLILLLAIVGPTMLTLPELQKKNSYTINRQVGRQMKDAVFTLKKLDKHPL